MPQSRETVGNSEAEALARTDAGGQRYPPGPVLSHSPDTSAPLFTLYLRTAEEHDAKRFKLLKVDTDQILIFCGLFSATVAALIVPSIDNLYPGDPVPFILQQILGTLQLPPSQRQLQPQDLPPPYSPPPASVLNNTLWSLSLLLSVSCALMALSLQRWAQPPTGVTSSYNLLGQAQLRTRFAARIESHSLAFLVETLHGLVHIAFAIFLVGLLLYLYNINLAVFHLAAVGAGLVLMVYAILTAMAIIQPGYPYSTPLSKVLVVLYGTFIGAGWVTYLDRYLSSTRSKNAVARQLDDEVLGRTFDLLKSDDDLEQFFEALPGFLDSRIADPRHSLELLGQQRLEEALIGFWTRTLTSIRVSESVKGQRLIICMRIIDSEEAGLSITIPQILRLSVDLSGVSGLVEIVHFLGTLRSGRTALLARVIIASIISTNDEHDKRWDALVMDELEISEDLFRRYLEHGNSLLLANLIHITRKFFHSLPRRDFDLTRRSLTILSSLSKFDIISTLPELQQEFCTLWDKVDKQSRKRWPDNERFRDILSQTRGLYDALVALSDTHATLTASATGEDGFLHQRASYPLRKMPDHCIQEGGGSITGAENHSATATSPTIPPHPPTSTVQGITVTSLTSSPSMVQPITQSLSETGDAPQPSEENGQESPSSASTTATSQLNTEAGTNSRRSTIRRRTSSTISSASSDTHYPGPIQSTTSSTIMENEDT